nr:hypothetical protein [Tanacetum cinerariifolium]
MDVKIHYVGGLWVWLQFSSVNSCEAFKSNESLNKLWTFIKVPSPSFVVDERVIWIEVSGLPLCAWDQVLSKKSLIFSVFGKNKHHQTNPIDNSYVKYVEKIATSFFVTNFSNSLDAKNLWKEFQPFGRIVDAFIANKRSKQGKRFGFVRFLGIYNEEVFAKSLSNVWIGSYHVFVTIAKFQRNPIKPHASTQQLPKASHDRPTFNTNNSPPKRSYASVTHAEPRNNLSQQSKLDNIKSIQLNDDDLILVDDSSTVVLIKFSSMNSCETFKSNESLNKLWTFIKVPSPSFVVDERVIWIEVSGLPLFKESALKDSKEGDQANVSTHVAGDNETLFSGKAKEEYFVTKEDRPSEEDVSDTSKPPGFENFSKKNGECSISSNASRSGNCSTSFGNYKRKELTGFSFIDEMSRMIEVGGTLGYDVKGCKKPLWKMINGIGVHPGKVILFGDLNEVRNDSKIFGFIFSNGDAAIFNDFILESGLIDLPMGGRSFTWMNKVGSKMSKLDRFLISDNVNHDIPNLQVVALDRRWMNLLLADMRNLNQKIDEGLASDEDKSSCINKLQELDYFEKMNSLDLMQKARVKWEKFSCHDSQVSFPLFMPAHRLNTSDQDLLEVVVSMEEIKTAVWDCGSNKAPVSSLRVNSLKVLIPPSLRSSLRPEQSAFILGQKVLDGPLILSEIIDWYKKRKKKLMLFKVDFEKAFDSVSWKYLDYMLHKMGFGSRWRTWINNCLMSARASILINGSPTSEFSLKRGLKQGDPLSPFLFIIIMGLHMALNDGIASNMFHGVRIGSSIIFYIASGLKINFYKSNVFGVGVSNSEVISMAACTGCEAGSFPFSYLGLPIGSNMSRIANWQILIDRFKARLSGWKANLLSIDGRLTLIKSVLGSLGIYYFSIFKAPEMVIKSLESLRANFFWGIYESSKKLSWVKWSNTLASFDKGGLGVGSLSVFNKALLLK